MQLNRLVGVLVVLSAIASTSRTADAQVTWVGTSGTALWGIGANWSSGVAPAGSGTANLVFAGTTLMTSTNNVANLSLSRLTLSNTSVATDVFMLSGSAVNLPGVLELLTGTPTMNADEIAFGINITANTSNNFIVNARRTLVLSGVIAQDGSPRAITKIGNGTLILTNTANSFATLSASGPVFVTQIGTAGLPSQTGTGAIMLSNGMNMTYTGAGETSDKRFQVGTTNGNGTNVNGLTLTSNGSGALSFTGRDGFFTTPMTTSTVASRPLTLQGTNTGDNTIAATIGDVNTGTTTLALTKAEAGKWILSGSNTYTGATTITAGTLQLGSGSTTGSLNPASVIGGSAGATLAFNRSNAIAQGTDFRSVIGGSINVSQIGSGRLLLNGVNTYSGTTRISAGILEIAPGGSIGSTSGITLDGSTAELRYNAASALTRPITLTQGMISGTGTIGTAVTFATGDRLSPGNSPGIQSYTSLHAWAPGGTYQWELNSLVGSAGTNWDLVNVTSGTFNLSALGTAPGSQFVLDLVTLDALNAAGPLANPFAGGSYTFAIASYNPTNFLLPTGFSNTAGADLTELFQINLGNWQGSQPQLGNISVKINSDATGINLVIVPEPGAFLLAGIGIAAAGALRRRQKAGMS